MATDLRDEPINGGKIARKQIQAASGVTFRRYQWLCEMTWKERRERQPGCSRENRQLGAMYRPASAAPAQGATSSRNPGA